MENIEKMVQEALDSTKSAHKRIDRMEKRQDNLEELTNAFSVLQNEQYTLHQHSAYYSTTHTHQPATV